MKTVQNRNCTIYVFLLVIVIFIGVELHSAALAVQNYIPGQTYYGRNQYIEYDAGSLPIILSAPHGGSLIPTEIPNRTYGETETDSYTIETALAIRTALYTRTGKYPHLVLCRLKRTKLDANREIVEAAQGNPYAEQAWNEFHNFIQSAKDTVITYYGKGLYIDLHGHGHTINRLELGYLLSSTDLGQSDAILNLSNYINKSSIHQLAENSGSSFSQIIRGQNSLGGLFSLYGGVPSVPSPANPNPGGYDYFTGGYNVERHGSKNGGTINGIQIEMYRVGIRDNATNRSAFAGVMSQVLDTYISLYLNINITTSIVQSVNTVPNGFELKQNYPNPFNPVTTIEFILPRAERVIIVI